MSMVSSTLRTARLPFAVSRPWSDSDVPTVTPCQGCDAPLSIHQPDLNAPERLLGTCGGCGSWYLIDCDRDIIVLLPDTVGLRNAEADL